MRVVGATIGALLISVSHIALAQEQHVDQHGDVRAEHQCDPYPAGLPNTWTRQDEVRRADTEQPLTESSARPPTEPAEMQTTETTAEQILAQLPEQRPTEPAEVQVPATTAERVLKELPDQRKTEPAEMQAPAKTAEQILAELPGERPTEPAEVQAPAMTAEQILAQLPEPKPAETPPTMTAEQVLADLPARRLVDPAEELLAQLPGRRLAEQPAPQAEQIVAALPERQVPEAKPADAEEPRQPEALKAEMEQAPLVEMEMPRDPKWAALDEPNLGTTVELPRAMFSMADGHAHKGVGRRYRTADGRAKVAVWTQRNTRHDTPASYLRRTFNIPRATVDYERFAPDFAVFSGVYGGRIYYIRCNLSSRHGTFHCFDLAYPARHKKAWDGIVTRMSQSLRPYER